jgi:hypothetical protein
VPLHDLSQQTVSKTIMKYSQTDSFSHIDTFVGTAGNDTFKGTLWGTYSFDGNGGFSNTLDYSALTTGVTFNVQEISGTVDKAPDSSWNGLTDTFSNIQHFTGGGGDDTFKITPDGLDYELDGGDGINTLDASAFTLPVTFDLKQHVVQGSAVIPNGQGMYGPKVQVVPVSDRFWNIGDFTGGSGGDTLIDGSGTTKVLFDGGDGNNTVVLSGNYGDYDYSASGYESDQLWHTVVNPISSTDAPLDLVHVEQLQFADQSSLPLAVHAKVYSASSLFTATGTIIKYQFWDSTADPASGHFVVNGLVQAKSQAIDVSAAQLGQTTFQSGSGSNDLWVRTFDGVQWSAWKEFHVMAPINHAPVVTASDQAVAHGANIAASSLFSVSDADRDVMTRYQFWDSTADAASGHFVVNGAAQGAGQTIR